MSRTPRAYWASRIQTDYRNYFWSELQEGRLRQGWGYDPGQDLRIVETLPWDQRSEAQQEVYRQRRMLDGEDGWQVGDIILVPHVPESGMFALVEVTGPYRFEIASGQGDFGHIREVRLLTPNGVANTSQIVGSALRSTLRTASRIWRVWDRDAEFERIIEHANDPEVVKHSTEVQRTEKVLGTAMEKAVKALQSSFKKDLNDALGKAEWENVIALTLRSHFPTAEVVHTGGPSEQGADVTIEIPDPFGGPTWVIVIQIKDYEGEVGPEVAAQLRQAIKAYRQEADGKNEGKRVVSAVLASTNASASDALREEASRIKNETGVPVTVIHGDALMKLILRGVVQHNVFGIDDL